MRRASTSSRIRSPFWTTESGPPTAASGAMWRTIVPKAVPLMRESEMRTIFGALARELDRIRLAVACGIRLPEVSTIRD